MLYLISRNELTREQRAGSIGENPERVRRRSLSLEPRIHNGVILPLGGRFVAAADIPWMPPAAKELPKRSEKLTISGS